MPLRPLDGPPPDGPLLALLRHRHPRSRRTARAARRPTGLLPPGAVPVLTGTGNRVPPPLGAGRGTAGPTGGREPLGVDRPRAVHHVRGRPGRAVPEQPLHRPRLEDRRLDPLEPHRSQAPPLPRMRNRAGPAAHPRLLGMGRRQRYLDRRGGPDGHVPASPGRPGRPVHLDRHRRRLQPPAPRLPGRPVPPPHRTGPVSKRPRRPRRPRFEQARIGCRRHAVGAAPGPALVVRQELPSR